METRRRTGNFPVGPRPDSTGGHCCLLTPDERTRQAESSPSGTGGVGRLQFLCPKCWGGWFAERGSPGILADDLKPMECPYWSVGEKSLETLPAPSAFPADG